MDELASTDLAMRARARPLPARPPGAWRLAVLVAGAILLPAAILATGAWGAWRGAWAEAARELQRSADLNADFVERVIAAHLRVATRIAESLEGFDDPAIRGMESELAGGTARLIADLPPVRGILVLDAAGAPVVRTGEGAIAWPAEARGRHLAHLRAAPAGQVVLGAAEAAPGDQGPFFPLGVRFAPRDRAVILLLDSGRIAEALARHIGGEADSAALIRADGQILARHPPFAAPPPPLGPDQPVLVALRGALDRGGFSGVTPRDGAEVAVAFRRLQGQPELALAVGRKRAAIIGQWREAVLPLLGIGLPAILALLGLALVVRRQHTALETALTGLEHRVAERTASLREGEERLRVAIAAGRFGTWETDVRTGVTTRSRRAQEIFGFPQEQRASPVADWANRIHPADRERVLGAWEKALTGERGGYREEYRFRRPDGAWRWLESTAAVVRSDPLTGRPLRMAGTIQDFTERHEAEERRELLAQEVNHRARNTLAIVQAILRLTRADNAAEFARLVEGRVSALARAQALLAAERWTGAPLRALLADEIVPFGSAEDPACPGAGRFALDGPALRIRAEAVQPLGMVFHELATNAVKHGALSAPEGRVAVTWQPDEAQGMLRIRWAEHGGPRPDLPRHRGVGSRVIEATIAAQLGGALDRRWPAEGFTCDITLPLARVRAGPA